MLLKYAVYCLKVLLIKMLALVEQCKTIVQSLGTRRDQTSVKGIKQKRLMSEWNYPFTITLQWLTVIVICVM